MNKILILYGTQGCHLCDSAETILQSMTLSYQYIDIIDDNSLMEKFAHSIPVLHQHQGVAPDLTWPFDQAKVQAWLLKT